MSLEEEGGIQFQDLTLQFLNHGTILLVAQPRPTPSFQVYQLSK
jgi:hypothetical protein